MKRGQFPPVPTTGVRSSSGKWLSISSSQVSFSELVHEPSVLRSTLGTNFSVANIFLNLDRFDVTAKTFLRLPLSLVSSLL